MSANSNKSGRRLRLLCLDGGGVRGLASLFMLKAVLSFVGNPKPHEFFDMIAGTSTGGLIAIMLGRLQMSVDECIIHYANIVDEIFQKKALLPFTWYNGKISSRYATSVLERHIKTIIESTGRSCDEKMREEREPKCKVFVVAVTMEGRRAVNFTSYQKPHESNDLYNGVTIWEAARATSSAPTFFDPIKITCNNITRTFVDGALGHNNPINDLWMEAEKEFGGSLEPQLRFILSLGTGVPEIKEVGSSLKDFAQTLVEITVETQNTATTFRRMHPSLVKNDGYFRFNPPYLDKVGLDEAKKKGIIQERTEAFLHEPDVEDLMERFGIAALDEELPMEPIQVAVYKERKTVLFAKLDGTSFYISPAAKTYWQHLTIGAYKVYEEIHGLCVSPNSTSGMVHVKNFLQHMKLVANPNQDVVLMTWKRLLRPEQQDGKLLLNTVHPKSFVMAVLYMLHIELCIKNKRPVLGNGETGIDMDRREALKRFTKNEWNFANDTGLSREGNKNCKIEKYLKSNTFPGILKSKELGWLKTMYESWSDATKPVR